MTRPLQVDAHVHVLCWGEDPTEGFLSERTRRAWLTRLLLWHSGVRREPGDTLSEKMQNRLLHDVAGSGLDRVVVLAQDAAYRADGSRDEAGTDFYVSNRYVLQLAERSPKILAGCSVNPLRRDALAELEQCRAAGSRLVKIHTAIHGVDPALSRFDPFYRLARELGVVLMFHTGYEHSCRVRSQAFADPARLARPLDHGGTVIAAHCGTCAFFDPVDFWPNFVDMMRRYENLYGDTSIMASHVRPRALSRLEREPDELKDRILHGSDYPFPPSRIPCLFRAGKFPRGCRNGLDLDLRIKQSFALGPRYTDRILDLLGVEAES